MLHFRISQKSAGGQVAAATTLTDAASVRPDLVTTNADGAPARDTRAETAPQPNPKPRSFRQRLPLRLFVSILLLLFLQTFVVEISVVPTGSMEGTILVGDHLFLDKLLYGPEIPLLKWRLPSFKTVRRGDIIVFRYPLNPEETFLKRVAAVPGDRLEIHDGVVYINSRPLNEPYAVHRRPFYAAHEQMHPILIPPGKLFVMGDNRDNSSDSREWGLVPVENVLGEPMLIYWSYDAPSARWLDESFASQLEFYASIAGNFFSRTRWERMGTRL